MRSALLTCTTASTSRRSWIRPIPSARPVPTVHMPIVREADLRGQGYRADIQHKGHAGKPLSEAQQRRNQRIARDRAFGAHPFARLTQQGGKCLRTIGLERARLVIGLKVVSHNLMRLARLQHRGIVPA